MRKVKEKILFNGEKKFLGEMLCGSKNILWEEKSILEGKQL